MSELKDLACETYDTSLKYIEHRLQVVESEYRVFDVSSDRAIVFIDAREPNDIEYLKRKYNAKTLLVKKDGLKYEPSNHADKDIYLIDYDIIISNNSDLNALKSYAELFVEYVFFGK